MLRRRAARPGDRLRAHEDPLRPALPPAARPRPERQGAARRHDPGPARRRDARLQGRPAADPRGHRRRRPRPGHLHGHPRHQLRRPHQPRTSTCTASGAPAASGARAARSPSSSRASSASSRRSSATSAPGSRRGPRARARRPPRSPSARAGTPSRTSSRDGDEPHAKLVAGVGRAEGVEVADLVHAVTSAAGIDGEAVRDVRVLERFSFLERPAQRRRARRRRPSNGTPVNGTTLRLEIARSLSARIAATARCALRVALGVCNPGACEAAGGRACPCARSRSGGPTPEPAGAAGEPARGRPTRAVRAARRWSPSRTGA